MLFCHTIVFGLEFNIISTNRQVRNILFYHPFYLLGEYDLLN